MLRSKFFFSALLFLFCTSIYAEQGDIVVRLRGIAIMPDDSSGQISLASPAGTSQVLDGSGVAVDMDIVPELDTTYMFHKNWGIEAIAGIANHNVKLKGLGPTLSSLGLSDGFKVVDTWVLPPTVTLQYHLMPENKVRPYVGLGVNYTASLWSDADDDLEAAVGRWRLMRAIAGAAQVGVDIDLEERWFVNFDVKYIDIDTSASLLIKSGALADNSLRVDLAVDPFFVGAGIGYRF